MSAGLPLTVTTNTDPFILTTSAQIVSMDLRTKTPVTVAMTPHGTMTREAYNLFLIKVMSTPRVEMDVDVNRTPDGHFDAHFKARGE